MSQSNVNMVQRSTCMWQIVTDKGIILAEDICIGPIAEAEEYVKRYITSFQNWTYKMVPLKEGQK